MRDSRIRATNSINNINNIQWSQPTFAPNRGAKMRHMHHCEARDRRESLTPTGRERSAPRQGAACLCSRGSSFLARDGYTRGLLDQGPAAKRLVMPQRPRPTVPRTFQDLIFALQRYWAEQGCVILQPYDME